MLKRRILYFICLAVVFGINIFYVEYQIFILLVLMIAIPLVSWIMYAISDVSLGLSLQVNKNVVQVGNRIKIRIVKKNACNLAFVNGSITIKYMYCHTGDEFMINVPIKQGIRKSAGITDISTDYCGNICVGVESIEICDYLGLFGKKKQFAGVTKVSVMPEETTNRYMETDRANAYYDEENEVYVKSASDEVSELREYRDGDSPRNIHWKRSSILAENDFIVKEYSTNINKTVFIVVDTDWRGEKSWRLSRMSRISFTKQFLLLLTRNYIILAKIDADMTVISPATATERLLIAPSISPISRAFVVPIAWDAVPIARPFATGSFILKIFKTASAIILPSTPVMIITATVIVCIPPSSSLTPIPIAVVIDFGKSVTYCSCVSPKKYDIKSILPILAKTPASMPINTSFACSLSTDI